MDIIGAQGMIGQLPKGAFLTVRDRDGRVNVMTIGWATVGYVWRMPVAMVMVRPERHTYGLIENADDFTLSVPIDRMAEELRACGTTSGRDMDKFEAHGLVSVPAKGVSSPVVADCDIYHECRMLHRERMSREGMLSQALVDEYDGSNVHVLYFGEIVESYGSSELTRS